MLHDEGYIAESQCERPEPGPSFQQSLTACSATGYKLPHGGLLLRRLCLGS
jgi:hypothetical protein